MDIDYLIWRTNEGRKRKKLAIQFLIVYGLVMHTASHFEVNGQIFEPTKASSLHRQITVAKGSSVWLHWQNTLGSGIKFGAFSSFYKKQIIGFKNTSQASLEAVAKRVGENGALTLESSLPVPFTGRVEVISSNNTLVIHDLQYNDSSYQFSSNIVLETSSAGTLIPSVINLMPSIQLKIIGIPDFIVQPPNSLDVKEQSNLDLRMEMNGYPKPSAEFKWSHLLSQTTVPSVQLYPFVYSSTYSLNSINGSYCGRSLQMVVKNDIGSSSIKITNFTVILNLDQHLDVKATRIPNNRCIEVKWKKIESGACYVKYDIEFKNESGNHLLYYETGYNIGEIKPCNLTEYDYITKVVLRISFNYSSNNFTTKVLDYLASNTKVIEESIYGAIIIGDAIRWSIFVVVFIALVIFCVQDAIKERCNVSPGLVSEDSEEGESILVWVKPIEMQTQEISKKNKISL